MNTVTEIILGKFKVIIVNMETIVVGGRDESVFCI